MNAAAKTGTTRKRSFAAGAGRLLARASLVTWRLALVAAFVIGGAAIGGFLKFVHEVQNTPVATVSGKADAIVVLTGGPGRIEAGLDLLAGGSAERMLISGVNPRTSGAAIRETAEGGNDAERARLFSCCVDLGRRATDTVGNSEEARTWIRERGYSHVIVVTADYHMQRSLLEFRRALEVTPAVKTGTAEAEPKEGEETVQPVRLTPYAVATPALRDEAWYTDPPAIRRLVGEWVKYLSAQSKGWFGAEFLKQWFPNA